MVKSTYTSVKSRLLSLKPSRFARDEDGIAAIEFAFIAPIMLFMYFGMAEIATAISTDRKISHSANVAGDLATQSEMISKTEMAEIMKATMMVMNIPDEKLDYVTIEITSYTRTDDDDPTSVVENGNATFKGNAGIDFPNFDATVLDKSILSSTSGVVVARVNYIYETLNLRYMPTSINISETFMLKPRKSANVGFDASGGSTNYTCTSSGSGSVTC